MQFEAPIKKTSDSVNDSKSSENLSVQNQFSEINAPGALKQANQTATAKLESSGGLPKMTLVDATKSFSDSATNPLKTMFDSPAATATTSDSQSPVNKTLLTANDLKQLNSSIGTLKTDSQALLKDPHSAQDINKVNLDEASLKTSELNYMHASAASTTFASYSKSMAGDHAELTNIATGLWNAGQKVDAGHTTSYFPTSNYEKYFNKTGTGPIEPTEPGSPVLKDPTSYNNMQNDTWNKNLKADEIGGKGINPDMQLSDSGNKLTATMSGGSYTDGLVSNTQKLNTSDNTVQLNYNVNVKPGSDLHALETDAAITTGKQADGKVLTAMAASQFIMNPKTGTMEFDTSGTDHQWVDAVNNIPMPKDGTNMDVSMTVKMVGDKYEYTGLDVNGKSYAISPADGTFTMTQIGPKGWAQNTIHTQLQQDLGASGGSSTVTYNDVQVNQGNT